MGDTEKAVAVIGVGAGLAGLGIMLLGKPISVNLGDTINLSKVKFEYVGPEAELYICWGLKSGLGVFDNGKDLVESLWTCGGPMSVALSSKSVEYSFVPIDDFQNQPAFYFDPDLIAPGKYAVYAWIADRDTSEEKYILAIFDGPEIDVKGD